MTGNEVGTVWLCRVTIMIQCMYLGPIVIKKKSITITLQLISWWPENTYHLSISIVPKCNTGWYN